MKKITLIALEIMIGASACVLGVRAEKWLQHRTNSKVAADERAAVALERIANALDARR